MNRLANHITEILVGVYIVLALLYVLGKNWPKALYWTGASILTIGVLKA